jgi:hypothetical protein
MGRPHARLIRENAMQGFARNFLVGVVAAGALAFGAGQASAQGWGPQVEAKSLDKTIEKMVDTTGMVRTRARTVGQVNLPEYEGTGTMVDVEGGGTATIPVTKYIYAVAIQSASSRLQFQGPNTPETIRVVKGNRAWNESWSADRKKISTTPAADAAATFRAQSLWVQPHAFMHAVAFANAKRLLNGQAGETPYSIKQEGGKTLIEIQINGRPYKGTLGVDTRPESIETMVTVPGGAQKRMVATFTGWRTGEKPDAGFGTSTGPNVLDKFHSGVYWPSTIVHTLDGQKVLDLTLTGGWANPYQIFPDPELLAKAQ